jgi:succinyl-diaminopimelate desuccinylase
VLTPALGNPPTVILGPGEAAMAHKTDEYCLVSRLSESVGIYSDIAAAWRGA